MEGIDPRSDELDFLCPGSNLTRSDLSVIGEAEGSRYKGIPRHKRRQMCFCKQVGTFSHTSECRSIFNPRLYFEQVLDGACSCYQTAYRPFSRKFCPSKPRDDSTRSSGTRIASTQSTMGPLKISNIRARLRMARLSFTSMR